MVSVSISFRYGQPQLSPLIPIIVSVAEIDSPSSTAAGKIAAAVTKAFPGATVQQNGSGKPRKGSFEITIVGDSGELFSKLKTYGVPKNRDHLTTPENVLNILEKKYVK